MRRYLVLTSVLCLATLCLAEETIRFDDVKIHRHKSPQKRVLVDKVGVLTFDDTSRTMAFTSHAGDKFAVAYDDVIKVVFETTTHMRGTTLAIAAVSAIPIGGPIASAVLEGVHVHDYWFYLEYKTGEQTQSVLLDVPKRSSAEMIDKVTKLFGARATVAEFKEEGEAIKNAEGGLDTTVLPDLHSKQSMKIDKARHPLPEIRADKATIVVVCPSPEARYVGASNQFKLHANDHVIAVNRFGTYSFAYIDPGKYRLVSQSENANGFEMDLEAGKTYYFLQNTFEGVWKNRTGLSRNSPELVMYELDGSYFSDWSRKEDK